MDKPSCAGQFLISVTSFFDCDSSLFLFLSTVQQMLTAFHLYTSSGSSLYIFYPVECSKCVTVVEWNWSSQGTVNQNNCEAKTKKITKSFRLVPPVETF